MRLGVYLDISNLYYTVKSNNNGSKINFSKYLDFIKDLGEIKLKKAFVSVDDDTKNNLFHEMLCKLGFELIKQKLKVYKSFSGLDKKCDLDVQLAVTLIEDIDLYDRVIIGSADGDFLPVYKYLTDRGKQVIIVASKISQEVSQKYNSMEIPPSLLIEKR